MIVEVVALQKRQILLAIRKAEKIKQEADKDLMDSPGIPSSPGSLGSLSPRSPGSGPVKAGRVVLEPVPCKLSPRSDTPVELKTATFGRVAVVTGPDDSDCVHPFATRWNFNFHL